MFKKILVGLAAVALFCMIFTAGYHFGRALAHSDSPPQAHTPAD